MHKFTAILSMTMMMACSPQGGNPEPEDYGCEEVSRTVITDLSTPIEGIVPSEVLAATEGAFSGMSELEAGTEEALDFTLSLDGNIEWVEYGTGDGGIEILCSNTLEVSATLTLEQDASLTESLSGQVVAAANQPIVFFANIQADDLVGTAHPAGLSNADSISFEVYAELEDGLWIGDLAFLGEATHGSGDDAAVSLEREGWANFMVAR